MLVAGAIMAVVGLNASKRSMLLAGATLTVLPVAADVDGKESSGADEGFTTTSSGLEYEDIRAGKGDPPNVGRLRVTPLVLVISAGKGAPPRVGDTVSVHWSGFTKGYQAKRIDNTSIRDEPYEFKIGANEAIPAFEEAVLGGQHEGIIVPGRPTKLGLCIKTN
eukprot:gene26956-35003_t